MNYIIIETQTNNGTTAIVTPATYDNNVDAESAFLMKAAYARKSGLDKHSVTLLNDEGAVVARKCFKAGE